MVYWGDLLHAAERWAQRCRHMPLVKIGCTAAEHAGVVEGARQPDVEMTIYTSSASNEGDPDGWAGRHVDFAYAMVGR